MIDITDKFIEVQKVIDSVTANSAGAINVFIGTVRDMDEGKKVVSLEYEAYENMAASETKKIIADAKQKWELIGWAVSHRVGEVKPGEVAVVVAVSTRHRKESFEACQFIIDSLKKKVPVFKKEIFEDGSKWVGAK